ncbi:unnamed protein product, partial [marine sediment metagenome]
MVKTHTFCGKTYKITIGAFDGLTDTFKKEQEMIIMTDPNTRAGFETAIHEALHACDWNKNEVMVEQTAYDIAR